MIPSAGGSHHCQHVESSGGKYDGGTMVSQQPGDPGSHENAETSPSLESLSIPGRAAPTGGLGYAVSGSQHKILALHPTSK